MRWASRPVHSSIGVVGLRDLLDWRGAPLSERMRSEIRSLYVDRFRVRLKDIWGQPIGILYEEGMPIALDDADMVSVRAILSAFPDGTLQHATLRQVKEFLKQPVAQVFRLLANMEAAYWGHHHVKQAMERIQAPHAPVNPALPADDVPAIDRGADWVGLARVVLARPWVMALAASDLRFPARSHEPLHQHLLERLDHGGLTEADAEVIDQLMQAERCSWIEEMRLIAHALLVHSHSKVNPQGRARRIDIFMLRFSGAGGNTLATVGEQLGLTRERVRQICSQMIEKLAMLPCQMPALDRALAAAARIAPFSVQDANEQLARMLGDGVGIEAVIEFAEQIGRPIPLQVVTRHARSFDGGGKLTVLVEDEQHAQWMKPALAFVRRDCMAMGCTNFLRVAGHLAFDEGICVDRESLVSVLKTLPGYRHLGADTGWFGVEDSERSNLADRVRKIMHAANGPVMLDSIMGGLSTDVRWISRTDNSGLALPPVSIVAMLLAGWPWLSIDHHNRCKLLEERNAVGHLSNLELGLVKAISDCGGVATKAELVKAGTMGLGLTDIAVAMAVGTSPVFDRLEYSLYAVRGKPLDLQAVERARKRRAQEIFERNGAARWQGASQEAEPGAPITVFFARPASELPLQRHIVYLPAFFRDCIQGVFRHKEGAFAAISINRSFQIPRLAMYAAMSGYGARAQFPVVFDMNERTFSIPQATKQSEEVVGSAPIFECIECSSISGSDVGA